MILGVLSSLHGGSKLIFLAPSRLNKIHWFESSTQKLTKANKLVFHFGFLWFSKEYTRYGVEKAFDSFFIFWFNCKRGAIVFSLVFLIFNSTKTHLVGVHQQFFKLWLWVCHSIVMRRKNMVNWWWSCKPRIDSTELWDDVDCTKAKNYACQKVPE